MAFAPLLLLEVLTASPKSHILTLLSRPPEASSVPSALKARLYTESECPRNSLTILPADRSHRRMRRSSPADTRYCPSGEIARSCIEPYKQTYINYYCRESSINSPGGIFISNTFEGGLIETGGVLERGGGGLFNSAKMVVSAPQKEPE